ncbi:DUF4136 domain-containing protein [Luminiphilus sp.]|nr:DUF4136 domain-containing protein [Luminiphilus sp.]
MASRTWWDTVDSTQHAGIKDATMIFRSVNLWLLCTGLLGSLALGGCSGVQVDTTPNDRFEAGNYVTYNWQAAALDIEASGVTTDPFYALDPTLRASVDQKLASKGYQLVDRGGDFQVIYQFKASITEGALSTAATDANNQDNPISSQDLVINRRADQALIDNAYALSGPREVTSILLTFTDGSTQNPVWAAGMSKVVDHANFDAKRMSASVDKAVNRALGRLPKAN